MIWSPTLRRAWPRDGPEAAICVQGVDVQCVLQFTLIHAAGCALHRRTSRVIHRSKLFSRLEKQPCCFWLDKKRMFAEKQEETWLEARREGGQSRDSLNLAGVELSPRLPRAGSRAQVPKPFSVRTKWGGRRQRPRGRRRPLFEPRDPASSQPAKKAGGIYEPSPWVASRTSRYPETGERTRPERGRRFVRSRRPRHQA